MWKYSSLLLLASAGLIWSGASEPTAANESPAPPPHSTQDPATTVSDWISQIEAASLASDAEAIAQSPDGAVVQVTDVRLNTTDDGIELILETPTGILSTPVQSTLGNAQIADIPNAVLALPDAEEFQAIGPTDTIALVSVTNRPDNQIRVAITGTDAPPSVTITSSAAGLIFSTAAGTAETAFEQDAIQIVTTATRTEELVEEVPRSVTVITQEDLVVQRDLSRDLREILGFEVPGFYPSTNQANDLGGLLRGRTVQYLINGVPIDGTFRPLRTIAPESIERIEVVRGANATFGAQASGGTVNIITRQPADGEFITDVEFRSTISASSGDGFLPENSFGYTGRFGVSADMGMVDLLTSFTYENTGSQYDAEGDRIFFDRPSDENRIYSALGTLGIDITDEQRLQFTLNHYDSRQTDSEFVFDPNSTDKAEGLFVGQQEFIDVEPFFDRTTVLNLSYRHENLFGNDLQAQMYYRTTDLNGAGVLDLRDVDVYGNAILSPVTEIENWGGRLQVETPLWTEASLLWGADYDNLERGGIFNVIDADEFEESEGRTIRGIDERTAFPDYNVNTLSLFSQLQVELWERLNLSGGLRYSNFDVDVPDYTTVAGVDVEGGSVNFDDVVFNAGATYQVTNELSLFASFAQGFALPELRRVLEVPPDGFSFEGGFEEIEPVKVDSYEIGIRGNWSTVQATLAAFYSYSDLGEFIIIDEQGGIRPGRAPQRNYGVEATVEWQPDPLWLLGSTFTWQEGENDFEEDGEFEPLSSGIVAPIKLTAYVENQTTPDWRNRIQVQYVGQRNEAFDEGIDFAPFDDYFVVDFISSLELGGGTLFLGVENIFNQQYLDVLNQVNLGFGAEFAPAARGRTLSLGYRISF